MRSSTSLPPGLWWQVPPSPNAATRLLAPVLARAELAARARPRERPAARLTGRPPLATACRRRLLAGVASLAVYLVGLVLSFDLPPLPAEPGALYPVLPTALLQSSLLLGTMAEAILPDLSSSQIVQLHPLAVIGLLASQTCQYTQRDVACRWHIQTCICLSRPGAVSHAQHALCTNQASRARCSTLFSCCL